MSIIRTERKQNYTVIPNEIINDDDLQDTELALLVYLLSKPPSWKVHTAQIASLKRFGSIGKIKKNMAKLREIGYVAMTRLATGEVEWTVYDEKKPQVENQTLGEPQYKKPSVEKPSVENRTVLLNTEEILSTEEEVRKEKINKKEKITNPSKKKKKSSSTSPRLTPATMAELLPTLSHDVAQDFLEYRRAKRAPLTPTAWARIAGEILKSKYPPDECLAEAMAAGWQGFRSDWMTNRVENNDTGRINGKTWRQRNEAALEQHICEIPDVPF